MIVGARGSVILAGATNAVVFTGADDCRATGVTEAINMNEACADRHSERYSTRGWQVPIGARHGLTIVGLHHGYGRC